MIQPSRRILDRELSKIRDNILALANMVEEAIELAMQALVQRDTQLAIQVSNNDQLINQLRYDVEEEALIILATQQPTAIDLRTVVTAIHVAVELERMGDHAAGIARMVTRMEEEEDIETLHKLPKMSARAQKMVRESIAAFLAADHEKAHTLVKADSKMDKHYRQVFRDTLQEMQEDKEYIERATYLMWAGHNLERIGDRAVNIAERVVFMATGKFVEFDV